MSSARRSSATTLGEREKEREGQRRKKKERKKEEKKKKKGQKRKSGMRQALTKLLPAQWPEECNRTRAVALFGQSHTCG